MIKLLPLTTFLAFGLLAGTPVAADTSAAPTTILQSPEGLEGQKWFQNARFGMFIHWGLYSMLGDGEWVMHNKKIPIEDYQRLAAGFYPSKFDAAEWVGLAKAAGMKYITFTSKHHDGFAMWDSKVSDWDIVEKTPFKRDVIKELSDECQRQGIKLFLYHSHLDWHHPDFFPRGNTGTGSGRPESGDWNTYLNYMDAQLTELLTGYGPIGGIWFDGHWDRPDADWRLDRTYQLIHKLQPGALIGNNHHLKPFPGEDFQMYERDLPGENTKGFSATSQLGTLPLETCDTMNGSWGYNITDRNYKSTRDLIHYLVRAAGYNANFLLNVGPTPGGEIQPEFASRLKEMGEWVAVYGESVFDTRGGPVPPQKWGVTTQRDNKVYVHVLEADDRVELQGFNRRVRSAYLLKGGTTVTFNQDGVSTTALELPRTESNEIDRVIVVETE